MPSQTRSPGTIVDDSSVGTVAWTNPGNAAASDNSRATANGSSTSTTRYLNASNYGFDIPAGATIDGIEANLERFAVYFSGDTNCKDSAVKLLKGGVVSGDNKADVATSWPSGAGAEAVKVYGGDSDLWGVTFTDDDINASDFGFVVSAALTDPFGDQVQAAVDHMPITVHYTEAAGGGINSVGGRATRLYGLYST